MPARGSGHKAGTAFFEEGALCGNQNKIAAWLGQNGRYRIGFDLYRAKVSGATDGDLNDLMAKGTIKLEKVKTVELPRKPEWFGW